MSAILSWQRFFFSVSNNLESACGSAPCFNGGTCKNVGEEGFSCTCAAHYSGAQCGVKLGKNVKNAEIFWQCIASLLRILFAIIPVELTLT